MCGAGPLTRLGIGQLEEVADLARSGELPLGAYVGSGSYGERKLAPVQTCEAVSELMSAAKAVLGYPHSGSHGIGHPHVSLTTRRAYEIKKVLDKVVATVRNPSPTFRGVNYDGLGPRYTEDQAPVARPLVQENEVFAEREQSNQTERAKGQGVPDAF